MRRFIAAAAALVCVVVPALLGGCSRDEEPNSLVDEAGYHVRDNVVFYLNPFPGKAFHIEGADASTFELITLPNPKQARAAQLLQGIAV